MSITRADLVEMDPEAIRDAALCYGLDVDGLSDDDAFAAFGDYLDDLEVLVS